MSNTSTIGSEQTTVELEHRLLDRLLGGQAMYDSVGGSGGWTSILEQFAKVAANKE